MLSRYRLFLVLSLVFVASAGLAQGGAGGYGQGGGRPGGAGGGGFGGGGRGGGDGELQYDKKGRPDDDSNSAIWESKTAILTPGDRYEIKLTVKKGETLLASATSDAFDPALAVEDAAKKKLAENDDRAEGDQTPFLICRFAADGTYTLKVLSFHSVAGGKFTVKFRTFLASDAVLGPAHIENMAVVNPTQEPRILFRLAGKKGKIYDLRQVQGHQGRYQYGSRFMRIIGPTGVEANDFEGIPGESTPVFKALVDGDYYLEWSPSVGEANDFKTDFREVAVLAAGATSEQAVPLAAGG